MQEAKANPKQVLLTKSASLKVAQPEAAIISARTGIHNLLQKQTRYLRCMYCSTNMSGLAKYHTVQNSGKLIAEEDRLLAHRGCQQFLVHTH